MARLSTFPHRPLSLHRMRLRCWLVFTAIIALVPEFCFAQATIEGRVELPKTSAAPVMIKRYEIVTKGGVLATRPPLAVDVNEWEIPSS